MLIERPFLGNLGMMGEFRYNKIEFTLSSPCRSVGKGNSLFKKEINDACIDVLEGASQRPAFYSPFI